MKMNMGKVDRGIRGVIAIAIGLLLLSGQLSVIVALVLGVFAVILLITSVIGFCPLYVPFKINTGKK